MCTLCQDISKYAKVLNQKDLKDSILVTKNEFKIMERILMELYCQNNDSEHYRECPSEEIVRLPIVLFKRNFIWANKLFFSNIICES